MAAALGCDHQHSTLIVVVLDGKGKQRSRSACPVSFDFRRRSGQAGSPTGLQGGGPAARGDLPGSPPSRQSHLGWQPSRYLSDRAEAERAFQLAEQLGSINAAAAELGTTWPSLRKAFTRHGLGMPARNPEAVRQHAVAAPSRHAGQPAAPPLDPVFVVLNPAQLPAARGPRAEQGVRLRRAEEIETLSYRTVVELYSESHARKPT